MDNIRDDRGYNQGFRPSEALRVRTERRAQAILDAMAGGRPAREILELGCGTGELSDLLAQRTQAQVVGTDLCAPFVEQAARAFVRPNLAFRVLDLAAADLGARLGQSFDYIVGNGILHHLRPDLVGVLRRLKTVLRPGGRLIFWEPNLHNPFVFAIFSFPRLRRWAKLEPDEMAFTRGGLARAFAEAGYGEIEVSLRDFLVPGTPPALIRPVVALGDVIERVPVANRLAQSVFVSAG